MITRLDYQRLLLQGIQPGKAFRVPMEDKKHYASQRMMFYRAMQEVKKTGLDTSQISSRKIETSEGKIFLEIFAQTSGAFLEKQEDGSWKEVEMQNSTIEEVEFAKWVENMEAAKKEGE